MDSVTQLLLGSAVAATVAPKEYRKKAILTGAILGTLPDLDVMIRYTNEVDNFTYHRSFSHSLLILPLFSLCLLPLLRRFYHSLSWQRLYLLIVLSLITHPLLDSLTAYGTQLFWPLAVTPTFISSILIVDPLYTLWLLMGVSMYLFSARWRWLNITGLAISTLYLGVGMTLQGFAKSALVTAYPHTDADKWFIGALTASPLCWRGVYKSQDSYIEAAFNVLHSDDMAVRTYDILPPTAYPTSANFKRLQWFNPNTVLRQRQQQLISSDLRMGEFGAYAFEFIITPDNSSGKKLPMFDKTIWPAKQFNAAAKHYAERNRDIPFPKQKWAQFIRCLGGGI